MQGLGLKNIQNRLNILKGGIHFEKGNENSMNTISLQVPVS
jgi:signal transduction histidine kinase